MISGAFPTASFPTMTVAPATDNSDTRSLGTIVQDVGIDKLEWLVEATPYSRVSDAEVFVYLSSGGFVTTPTDTPANQPYDLGLSIPYRFRVSAVSSGISSSAFPSIGDIVIDNPANVHDGLRKYLWGDRDLTVYVGDPSSDRSGFSPLLVALSKGTIVFNEEQIRIPVRDLSLKLQKEFIDNEFLGFYQCLRLDGASDQLDSNNGFIGGFTDGPYVLQVRVKSTDLSNDTTMYLLRKEGNYQVFTNSSGDIILQAWSDALPNGGEWKFDAKLTVNEWVMVTLALPVNFGSGPSDVPQLMIDDIVYDKDSQTSNPTGSVAYDNPISVGGIASNRFKGEIDEVRLWQGAVTNADVQENYNRPVDRSSAFLHANWRMDEGIDVADAASQDVTFDEKFSVPFVYYPQFDGVNDEFSVADNSLLEPSRLTIETWIATGATATVQEIVFKAGVFRLLLNSAGKLRFDLWNGSNWTTHSVVGTTVLSSGVRYHVAGTFDGNDIRVFVNGIEENIKLAATITTSANSLIVGSNGSTEYFNGVMSEMRLWSEAMNSDQLIDSMNTLLIGTETDLNALWHMDDASGNAIDSTVNGLDLVINGVTWKHAHLQKNSALWISSNEGLVSSVGETKPWGVGFCPHATPILIDPVGDNAEGGVFMVSAKPSESIEDVYVDGLVQGKGTLRTDLYATTVGADPMDYDYQLTPETLIKFKAPPAGKITVTFKGDNTGGYVDQIGDVIQRIATTHTGGITASQVDTKSVSKWNKDFPGVVGIFMESGSRLTRLDMIEKATRSVMGFITFTRDGFMRLAAIPSLPWVASRRFADDAIISFERKGKISALWSLNYMYDMNWTEFSDSDFAGAVSEEDRFELKRGRKSARRCSQIIRETTHLDSEDEEIESIFINVDDAENIADRIWAIRKFEGYLFDLVTNDPGAWFQLELGDVIKVNSSHHNVVKDCVILSIDEDPASSKIRYTLYGDSG